MGGSYFELQIDDSIAKKLLSELGKPEQLPFAMSLAINNVMTLIRDAFRGDMQSVLNLRRVAFNLKAVRVKPGDFALKSKLYSILSIDAALAPNLIRLNEGRDHISINGKKYILMPSVSVFGGKIITSSNPLHPSNLHLVSTPHGLRGNSRTFLVHSPGKAPVILQRTHAAGKARGKKKSAQEKATGNRIIYTLVRRTKTPKKIDLRALATRVVREVLEVEVRKAVAYAVRTARAKS